MTLPLPSTLLCRGLLALAMLLLCSALLAADAPYLHDFAEWLYQGQILKNLVLRPEIVDGFMLVAYPVPNSLATVLLAAISALLPAAWAGKMFLVLLLAAWVVVIKLFVRRHFEESAGGAIALILFATVALASFFWYGFVGYQVGLLLLTWFLALDEDRITAGTIAAFSIALFFAHAMVFLVFGALICVRLVLQRDPLKLLALAPVTLLSLWFLIGRHALQFTPPVADAQWSGLREALLYKLGFPAMLGPFRNFLQPDGASLFETHAWVYWLGFLTNFLVVALLGIFVLYVFWKNRNHLWPFRSGADISASTLTITIGLLALMYMVAPYNFFGLINPGGRLILPIILMSFIVGRAELPKLARWIFWPVALCTLLSCGSYFYLVTSMRGADIPVIGSPVRQGSPVHSVFEFNEVLYANTRFKYFNYRIFAFADRFERMTADDYSHLAFRTGLIIKRPPEAE